MVDINVSNNGGRHTDSSLVCGYRKMSDEEYGCDVYVPEDETIACLKWISLFGHVCEHFKSQCLSLIRPCGTFHLSQRLMTKLHVDIVLDFIVYDKAIVQVHRRLRNKMPEDIDRIAQRTPLYSIELPVFETGM